MNLEKLFVLMLLLIKRLMYLKTMNKLLKISDEKHISGVQNKRNTFNFDFLSNI